jgi:hypothetical protein
LLVIAWGVKPSSVPSCETQTSIVLKITADAWFPLDFDRYGLSTRVSLDHVEIPTLPTYIFLAIDVGEQDSLICACLSFYRPLANHHKLVKSWSLLFFLAVDVRVKDALIRPFFSFYQPAANQHKRANLGRTSGSLMFNLS